MSFKDLGPNVSQDPQAVAPAGGQYTAEDHSFESIVIQQNKPAADWEMNLLQEVMGSSGLRSLTQNLLPSHWLNNGFLERSDISSSYIPIAPDPGIGANANLFQLRASDVILNGWQVKFDLTQSATPGINLIEIPVPPLAGKRTDLIILEAWRALISPAPSIVNKSPSGQILRHGNAKSPDGPPIGNENLADDLIDPVFLTETSRRVQIQYRYRVIPNVNVITYPDGLDDPALFANTAPYYLSLSVDGAASAFNYVKHPTDPGLWTAGSNNPAGVTALGTVDGLMYAIPLCAVFRRNSAAFDRVINPNGGGLMVTAVTGRPDGIYSDQVTLTDILDMRKGVAWDIGEVLDKSFQEVLNGTLTTTTQSLASIAGPSLSAQDDIGTSGHIGNTDSIRRDFSDRSVTETIVAKVVVGAPTTSIVFNLSALIPAYGAAPINILALAPVGTNINSFGRVRLVTATTDTDVLSILSPIFATNVLLDVNIGPGIDRCTITLNAAAAVADIFYVEFYIEYPGNSGISRNINGADDLWTPPAASIAAWADPAALTATSDVTRFSLNQNYWWVDVAHRELTLEIPTVSQASTFFNPEASAFYIPDYVTGLVTINDGLNPVYATSNYSYNTGYTRVVMSFARPLQTSLTVSWFALRAAPPVIAAPGDSYQLFYTSTAVQSVPVPAGNQTLSLTPRAISKNIHVILNGTGSPDFAFPFSNPGEMIPVGLLPGPSYPEARLNTPNLVSIVGFGSNTGYAALPTLIPYSPDPSQVTLFKSAPDTTIDGDNRNFWPKSDAGLFPVYSPTVFAQQLAASQRRKTAFPVIMELRQDFPSIGRKGTFILVVFSDWSDFSNNNSVELFSILSSSCASVYKIRGSMMNPRRISP